MTYHAFSTEQKLRHVEHLIEIARQYGRRDGAEILRAIAADIRARMEGVPGGTIVRIEARIDRVMQSKLAIGYENGTMVGLAQETLGAWPTLRQALEAFQRQDETEATIAMLQMMAQGLAAPETIRVIEARFPGVAKLWEKA